MRLCDGAVQAAGGAVADELEHEHHVVAAVVGDRQVDALPRLRGDLDDSVADPGGGGVERVSEAAGADGRERKWAGDLRVDQAEVLPADGDALGAHADGEALAGGVARPVPLHAVVLQRRDQLQRLVLHRALAQALQPLVAGDDTAGREERETSVSGCSRK